MKFEDNVYFYTVVELVIGASILIYVLSSEPSPLYYILALILGAMTAANIRAVRRLL